MANEEMGMAAAPAPSGAQAGISPDQMAIYEQMRQNISPKEFSDEMLAGAEQVDPQAVATFRKELDALDVPMEVLDALNNLVDEILANPENYDEIRQRYMDQGIPEDILPEQFDPNFFAALNMAIDQMIAEPAGPQAFAKGGIAELSPISKAVADYGRNGDTMLAHITPAEARMLRRRGGAGTTNPKTGLPEFFSLKGIFKSIGNAVKGFVNSSVGKIVTTVALGFFLGPAAASFMGVTSAAGVAAVGGFLGSAGSTLLGGGNLRDALKSGAMGGLTAGVVGGVTSGFSTPYAGPTTVGGQVDAFKGMLPGGTPPVSTTAAPVPGAEAAPLTAAPGGAPVPETAIGTAPEKGMFDTAKDFYSKNISPSGIKAQGQVDALAEVQKQFPGVTAADIAKAPTGSVLATAYKAALPGMLSTYGPAVGLGIGALGLAGGFSPSQTEASGLAPKDIESSSSRIAREGTQRKYYVQGLPGVKYDQYGAPIAGGSTAFPTVGLTDYDAGGMRLPGTIGGIQGIAPRQALYATPSGSIGSKQIAQPYNNADMYSNLVPRGYADGGSVTDKWFAGQSTVSPPYVFTGDEKIPFVGGVAGPTVDKPWTPDQVDVVRTIAGPGTVANPGGVATGTGTTGTGTTVAQQQAARNKVAQNKAMRRAAGSGTMYANINAGLSALAPETNPMDTADTTFGARNRQAQLDKLQQTYGSMLGDQRAALRQQGINTGYPLPSQDGERYVSLPYMPLPLPYPGATPGAPPEDGEWYMPLPLPYPGATPGAAAPSFAPGNILPPAGMGRDGGNDAGQPGGGWGAKDVSDKAGFWGQNPGWAGWHEKALSFLPDTQAKRDEQLAIDMSRTIGPSTTTAAEQATKNALADQMRAAEHGTAPTGDGLGGGISGPTGVSAGVGEAGRGGMGTGIGDGLGGGISGPSGVSAGVGEAGRGGMGTGFGREGDGGGAALGGGSLGGGMGGEGGGFGGFGGEGNGTAGGYMATGGMVGHYALGGLMAQPYGNMPPPANTGGIAALGAGGYPRRTGQISGPGTEKSDSIPAMLSDGEFVMTAKSVRAAGKGDRRAGAKRMYKLMHQLEKNSGRG